MNRIRTNHLLRSSLIVILFVGLNKIGGFIRLVLVSKEFGAGVQADALSAAMQLPELFVSLVSGGALAVALIPVYSRYLHQSGAGQSLGLANAVITLVGLMLGVVCGLGAWQAPWLARVVLVPDYTPAQQQLTADLMRIVMISMAMLGLSGVLSALLNAHQHFTLPALATVAIDAGNIFALFVFVPFWGIYGVAWGMVLAAGLNIGVQLPALIKHRLWLRPTLHLRHPGLPAVIRLMGPRIIMAGVVQAADLIVIRLASSLPAGSIAAYFYAYLIMSLPISLFGYAIAQVVFPTAAELHNAGNLPQLKLTITAALQAVWLLTIPAAIGLVALGTPGIAFLLERGAFDQQATRLVYLTLVGMSLRIVSEAKSGFDIRPATP